MPRQALPKHLQNRNHEDWLWPFSYIPRGWSAFKFFQPPKLLIGYNVRRWDMPGDLMTIQDYPYGTGWLFGFQSTTHGPNAIQKLLGTWRFSFHISFPLCIHFTIKYNKRRKWTKNDLEKGEEQGYDCVRMVYGRIGFRWDSYDKYYNLGAFIGTVYN